jgi:hypothetical protein
MHQGGNNTEVQLSKHTTRTYVNRIQAILHNTEPPPVLAEPFAATFT